MQSGSNSRRRAEALIGHSFQLRPLSRFPAQAIILPSRTLHRDVARADASRFAETLIRNTSHLSAAVLKEPSRASTLFAKHNDITSRPKNQRSRFRIAWFPLAWRSVPSLCSGERKVVLGWAAEKPGVPWQSQFAKLRITRSSRECVYPIAHTAPLSHPGKQRPTELLFLHRWITLARVDYSRKGLRTNERLTAKAKITKRLMRGGRLRSQDGDFPRCVLIY